MRTALILLLVLLFPEMMVKNVLANAGDLDPTFDSDGKTRVGFRGGNDSPCGIYPLSNGGYLAAASTGDAGQGQMCLSRYLADGSSDPSFGDGGVIRLPVDPFPSAGTMTLLGDGRIVVAGFVGDSPKVARFLSDGTPDPSYGSNGVATLTGVPRGWVTGVVVQGTRIVLSANLWTGSQYHFALIRVNDNGTLDSTFDGDGFVITPILQSSTANAIILQTDGKIVLAGYGKDLSFRYAAVIARYDANGVLDATFDGDGKVITYAGSSDTYLFAVTLQSTKIVVAGDYGPTGTRNGLIIRYNSNGTLDATFGPQSGTGILIQPVGGGDDTFRAIRILYSSRGNASRIIVAGGTHATATGSRSDIVVCEYLLTGALDTAFDGDGIKVTSTSTTDDRALFLLQPGSKIVVAGYSGLSYQSDIVILRYATTNGVLDATFDGEGIRLHDIGDTWSSAVAIVQQPDGRILLGGNIDYPVYDMAVARLNADGSRDATFSGDGRMLISFWGQNEVAATDMVLQPDGRILLAGLLGSTFFPGLGLARLLPDGSLDPAFGGVGSGTIATVEIVSPHGLGLQNNSNIIVAGDTKVGGQDVIRVNRFNTDGTTDQSFAVQGRYNSSLAGGAAYSRDVVIQSDDAIIVAGIFVPTGEPAKALILRLTPSGAPDPAYGTGGFETTDIGPGSDVPVQAAIQPDGRIVVAGYSVVGDDERRPFVLRYDTLGHLDPTFDGDGFLIPEGLDGGGFYAVALDSEGRILLAGGTSSSGASDMFVMRLLADGRIDPSFGSDGVQNIDYDNDGDAAQAIATSQDGDILVAGIGAFAMAAARLEGGPPVAGVPDHPLTAQPLFVGQPWPNPTRQGATIEVDFKSAASGSAEVFDPSGRLVRRLPPFISVSGPGHLTWDGRDDTGSPSPAGVYFIRVEAGDRVERRRVVVVR